MDEALGVLVVGGGQDAGAAGPDGCGGAVDVGRGVQAQPGVPVLGVVPRKECLAVRPGCLDRAEAGGRGSPAGT